MKRKRDFINVTDFSIEEIWQCFKLTDKLKNEARKGVFKKLLKDQTLAMIFEKTSTRTRVSFEVGMYQLGGHALFLSKNDIQLNKGETIYDTAKVLSRYVNGIMLRTFAHENVVNLANSASVPVINGLSDLLHPCQAMADFYTIFESKPQLKSNPKNFKLTFIGDGNNVASSLLLLSAMIGNTFAIANPQKYNIPGQVIDMAKEISKKSGATLIFEEDPNEAAANADVLYTDVWVSMGQESEAKEKVQVFKNYQINRDLLKEAKTDAIILHCLPANRGMEITDDMMDGPHSRVFDEAENRMHVQKALMVMLMG